MAIISRNKERTLRYGSSQRRYAAVYVTLTFCVLLFLNIYCSQFSQQLFYESKQQSVVEKAQLLTNEIQNLDALTPSGISSAINKITDLSVAELIVTDSNGFIIYDHDRGIRQNQHVTYSQEIGRAHV